MAKTIGLERMVFVQASAYGADNRCIIDAMREVGAAARCVIGIDDSIGMAELEDMNRAGVRGVRLNVASRGLRDVKEVSHLLQAAANRIAPLGWHLQLFTDLAVIEGLADILRKLPVPIVIDHFGLAVSEAGLSQPGFSTLLDLLSEGRCWVKLSGCYRISRKEPDFLDAAPIAKALIATNVDRLVWGTDWPHTGSHGHSQSAEPDLIEYRQLDDGILIDQLAAWTGGSGPTLQKILVHNPAQLYGF